jgi:hypothetical protein
MREQGASASQSTERPRQMSVEYGDKIGGDLYPNFETAIFKVSRRSIMSYRDYYIMRLREKCHVKDEKFHENVKHASSTFCGVLESATNVTSEENGTS